jgi:hypothetical protein
MVFAADAKHDNIYRMGPAVAIYTDSVYSFIYEKRNPASQWCFFNDEAVDLEVHAYANDEFPAGYVDNEGAIEATVVIFDPTGI